MVLTEKERDMKQHSIAWVVGLAVGCGVFGSAWGANPVPSKRPNIVVLVADDWGFSDVGAFGGEIATPHLDTLAKKGVRFSNFHSAASCSPTRSMLLTGVDNHRNGVGNLREAMPSEHLGKPGYQGSLSTNVVTVASLLQDSGYRTYITGKWNVGSEPYNLPNKRGFDKSIVQGDTGSDNWEPEKRYLAHLPEVYWFEDGAKAVMPKEFFSSTYFVDRMLGYMKDDPRKDQPFFAYVGFQANHVPVQAPKEFVDKYKGRYRAGWTALREERLRKAVALGLVPKSTAMVNMGTTLKWEALEEKERLHMERQMEVYAAMAESMDFEVGRLLDYLRKTNQFDNTVFVFLSDNGPEGSDYTEAQMWLKTQYTQDTDKLGSKGAYGIPGPSWASASASPLSTYKFYAGEGGIRVPMLVSVPGSARQNHIETALTHVTDIAPTLLDLAQIKPAGTQYKGVAVEPMIGRSLVPLLLGQAIAVRSASDVLGYELSGNAALFKGTLKLTKNSLPVGDGQWHLYDLEKDPGETQDLSLTMPVEFAAMQADYAAYVKANNVLTMPEGYTPQRQVLINSLLRYFLPTYGPYALLVLIAGAAWFWTRRRRKVMA